MAAVDANSSPDFSKISRYSGALRGPKNWLVGNDSSIRQRWSGLKVLVLQAPEYHGGSIEKSARLTCQLPPKYLISKDHRNRGDRTVLVPKKSLLGKSHRLLRAVFVKKKKKKKSRRSFGECHDESISRQPPHHEIEAAHLRETARARMHAVREGRGAEVGAV